MGNLIPDAYLWLQGEGFFKARGLRMIGVSTSFKVLNFLEQQGKIISLYSLTTPQVFLTGRQIEFSHGDQSLELKLPQYDL